MAMTLRLNPREDEALAQLAKASNTSKNLAVAAAIDLAISKADHTDFVHATTSRLLSHYSNLMERLAAA